MKMRYSLVPSRSVGDKELSNGSFRTLASLCLFTSQMGIAYPNQWTMADIRGCTQSNIAKQMKQLRELATDPVPSWEEVRSDYLSEVRKPPHVHV